MGFMDLKRFWIFLNLDFSFHVGDPQMLPRNIIILLTGLFMRIIFFESVNRDTTCSYDVWASQGDDTVLKNFKSD